MSSKTAGEGCFHITSKQHVELWLTLDWRVCRSCSWSAWYQLPLCFWWILEHQDVRSKTRNHEYLYVLLYISTQSLSSSIRSVRPLIYFALLSNSAFCHHFPGVSPHQVTSETVGVVHGGHRSRDAEGVGEVHLDRSRQMREWQAGEGEWWSCGWNNMVIYISAIECRYIYIYLKCILVPIEYTWLYILSTCWIMWNTWHGLVMDEPNWIAAFIRWKMQEVETDRLNLAKLWCLNKLRRMQWKSMLIPEQTLTLPAPPKRPLLWLLLPCLIAEEPSPRCHLAARRDPTKGLMFRCVEDSSFFATCTGTRYVYR